MAASVNPSGNHHQKQSSFNGGVGVSNSNPRNGNSGPGQGQGNSGAAAIMKHNPGIDETWTVEEQEILDNGLIKFASDGILVRYAKIAKLLPKKTVREVALRCRWVHKIEIKKRRKEDHPRRSKDKREKITNSSVKSSQPPYGHCCPMSNVALDNDDGIPYNAIGGPTRELLEQNTKLFDQICANFSSFQVQENISLFCQARSNINKIINSTNDTPDIMKKMPPLPVKLDEELADTILPRTGPHIQ